jgi:hypothetical protein
VDRLAVPTVITSAAPVAEPVHQAHAVDAGRVLCIVVASGDETVQRHRIFDLEQYTTEQGGISDILLKLISSKGD